jgi:hypothetical protein
LVKRVFWGVLLDLGIYSVHLAHYLGDLLLNMFVREFVTTLRSKHMGIHLLYERDAAKMSRINVLRSVWVCKWHGYDYKGSFGENELQTMKHEVKS